MSRSQNELNHGNKQCRKTRRRIKRSNIGKGKGEAMKK